MTAATAPHAESPLAPPSVLAVIVVRDAAEWLRESLQALAAQTYPRLAILAIDDGSSDGSHDLLVQALGDGRVTRHDDARGLARSLQTAVALPVAAEADFLLLLHDDVALDPEAVQRMVDATMLPGVERVGIVGAKVVDWTEPRRLHDIGRSADRFGHPYTPLQAGEIDQGQFDRVLEVLAVDACAMLVRREVWQRLGLLDERLGDDDGDLDLCWRARVGGWRVLMTPLARARHRGVEERADRPTEGRSRRYDEDRAALATIVKNYGLLTLLWVVPLGVVLTVVRVLFLVLSRRFEEAIDVVAAVGWNLVHLPGTLSRRRRVQKAREVRDRDLRRFTESAGLRIPRWFQTAERIWEEQRDLGEEDEGEPTRLRLRHRTTSLVSTHPVMVASFLGVLVGAFAVRHLIRIGPLAGGVVPTFPDDVAGFFGELVSATRTTALGGPLAASPALAAMGGLSALLLGSTELAQKALLIVLPVLGSVLCYRACVRLTGSPGPSVAAAAAYGLSAVMLWSFSEGRIDVLVALAALPPIAERIESSFSRPGPSDRWWRVVVGLGVTVAVAVAFWPGVVLAVLVVAALHLVAGPSRGRGLAVVVPSLLAGAVLLFPFVPALIAGGGVGLGSEIGTVDPWALGRLALGDAPGSWGVAWFLPVAAAVGLALSTGERRAPAARAGLTVMVGLGLAWASSAGYLPAVLANAPAYVAIVAVGEAFLVAYGLASAVGGLGHAAFGFRQIGTVSIVAVLAGGLALQGLTAALGDWGVGGSDREVPAWEAIVDTPSTGSMRVLWIGADDGRPFPWPGGDPAGVVEAGDATVRFGLTDRRGRLAIDVARPLAGPGADALRGTIAEILSGSTRHGGALLVPFGVKYVVAREGELPPVVEEILAGQADLDLVPATDLVLYRNAEAMPPAAVIGATDELERLVATGDPALLQTWHDVPFSTLRPRRDGAGWEGPTKGGDLAIVSTEFDGAWRVEASDVAPERAFGWATSLPVSGDRVTIDYGGQLPRTIASVVLGVLWIVALWITRKPVRR